MICPQCSSIINKKMKFCPYCGSSQEKSANSEIPDEKKQLIEKLYANGAYNNILDIAMQGDVMAKTYYIRYMKDYAKKHRGLHYKNNSKLQKLQACCLEENAFSMAAYGLFLYLNADAKIQAWDYEEQNRVREEGAAFVKKAMQMQEVAAVTIWAEWMSEGSKAVKKDEFNAYQQMRQAADQNYPPAMYLLGMWHYKGTCGASKKEEEGYQLIEKAAFVGDEDARQLIRQNDKHWFDTELGFSIPKERLEGLVKISNFVEKSETDDKDDFSSVWDPKLNMCRSIRDYVDLYKSVCGKSSTDEVRATWLIHVISQLAQVPLNKETVQDAIKTKNDYQQAQRLIESYTCMEHFLHLKQDLARLGLRLDSAVMKEIMNRASEIMRSKYNEKILDGISYSTAAAEVKKAGSTAGIFIWAIIILVALTAFFSTVGLIIGIVLFLGSIGVWRDKVKNKKIAAQAKENYLLVNALVGYGYTLFESWIEDKFEYNKNEKYNNQMPSVLDK